MSTPRNRVDLFKQKPALQKDKSPVGKAPITISTANKNNAPETSTPQEATSSNLNRVINVDNLLFEQQQKAAGSQLFEDPFFLCSNQSLSNDFKNNLNIDWLRPNEISTEASLAGSKFSAPVQQQLGDCWFVCACYSLANSQLESNLFKYSKNEFGMLKFRFFVKGLTPKVDDFIEITIDDRLPVRKTSKDLIYGRCVDNTQFWFPLLEKAYAKLYGSSYENIVSGVPEEAFIDLCGAFTLYLNPQDNSDTMLIVDKLTTSRPLIACADTIPLQATINNGNNNAQSRKSHSFAIVGVSIQQNNAAAAASSNIIIHLKNVWASSNMFFKELWNANCKKSDYSDLYLKLKDFQKYFGALTLVLHIPDESSSKAGYTEFCGSLSRAYSLKEIKEGEHKEAFVNYLLDTCEFYLLEIHCQQQKQTELLFNLTQYTSDRERAKLRLCIIEINNDTANYSNRIQTNRNGRTLSKLLPVTKKHVSYLILLMSVSESQLSSINYLFRCLHTELNENEIKLRKMNARLLNESIKLDVKACESCGKVLTNEVNKGKIHQKDDNKFYCDNCNAKQHFNRPLNAFQSLINDYNSVL